MGDYWLHGSSSCRGLWPPFFCHRGRFTGATRLLCRLWHDFFNNGGWTEAPLSRSAHRIPVILPPDLRSWTTRYPATAPKSIVSMQGSKTST
jgi:hypothetical protein